MLKNPQLLDIIWYYMIGKEIIAGKIKGVDIFPNGVTFVNIETFKGTKINMNIDNCFSTHKDARAYQIAWECSKVDGILKTNHYKKDELEQAIDEYGHLFI